MKLLGLREREIVIKNTLKMKGGCSASQTSATLVILDEVLKGYREMKKTLELLSDESKWMNACCGCSMSNIMLEEGPSEKTPFDHAKETLEEIL